MKINSLALKQYTASILTVILSGYTSSTLAGYPVIDAINNGLESIQEADTVTQLIEIQNSLQQLQQLNEIIGEAKDSGISTLVANYFDKYLKLYTDFKPTKQFNMFSAYMPGATEEGLTFDDEDFKDIETTKERMTEIFYGSDQVEDVSTANQYRKVRNVAHQEAALHGYAVSQVNRQTIAEYGDRADELSKQINDGDTVIDEIANNTAALVVIIRQLNDVQAVLTSTLEVNASRSLSKDSNVHKPRDN